MRSSSARISAPTPPGSSDTAGNLSCTHRLLSRATDEQGRTQPATISDPDEGLRGIDDGKFPWNQKGYANDAYGPLGVTVTVED